MLNKFYAGSSSLLAAIWLYTAWSGWEPFAPAKKQIPQEVRASGAGVRGFHFWHTGYHGGK